MREGIRWETVVAMWLRQKKDWLEGEEIKKARQVRRTLPWAQESALKRQPQRAQKTDTCHEYPRGESGVTEKP